MNGRIYSLNGIWKVKGATSDRGAMSDWPNAQPYQPDYDAPVPGTDIEKEYENDAIH